VRTGTKNASSTSTAQLLDAFVVSDPPPPPGAGTYEETDPAISYTGAWYDHSKAGDSAGSAKYTYAAGGAAELRFSGTAIGWVARRQANAGITDVFIDGAKVATVDLYNPSAEHQKLVFAKAELAPGTHTIRLVRTGTKNASSTSTAQLLDAFVVSSD
jgi:hypothetical protein